MDKYRQYLESEDWEFVPYKKMKDGGMNIREIGGIGEPTVEVEGDEHIKLPNGFSQEIKGKKHSEGGIPLNLPQGTQIFSEKLKVPVKFLKELIEINPQYAFLKNIKLPEKGMMSYADLAKKFETKKYVDLLNSKDADPIQKATAQLMINKNNQALEALFALQEQNKRSGVHGEQVQFNAMQDDMQTAADGGLHKAQTGYEQWKGQTFKTQPGIQTPTGVSLNVDPMANWTAFAEKYAPYDERITKKPTPEATAALQEVIYDEYLDTSEGQEALNKMWQDYGVTNKMESQYGDIAAKIKNKQKLSLDDLNRLRGNYIDTFRGKRLPEMLSGKKPTIPAAPATKEPEKQPEAATPATVQQVNKTYEMPGMGIGIGLPNAYGRLPLNYYKTEPQYIDPRYLDIQPQLNRIGRAQRAVETNLGSRGSSDIANLLQAQANRAGAEQEAFGQKYNYDRAQDAAAQQFNAQAKQAIDQYNQQSWYQQLEDPIRRRESAIETQKMMDAQAAIENARQMQAFYGNKDFIGKTFYPYKDMTSDDILAQFEPSYLKQYLKKAEKEPKIKDETTQTEKYGGKVKGKIKIKPKLRK